MPLESGVRRQDNKHRRSEFGDLVQNLSNGVVTSLNKLKDVPTEIPYFSMHLKNASGSNFGNTTTEIPAQNE